MSLPDPTEWEASYLTARPTKAMVTAILVEARYQRDAAARAHEELARVNEERAQLAEERDRWRDEHLPDKEAEALAACIRALDAMRSRSSSYAVGEMHSRYDTPSGSREGRILLHLAGRYGIDLQPPPPPEPQERPITMAEAIHRIAQEQGGYA